MKTWFLYVFLLPMAGLLQAQKTELMVRTGDNGLYLEHKVAPKQSLFALGRMYNVHPRHLAAYNKLDYNKGLQIDQKLRIPLTDTNFTQTKGSGTPVYYKVGDKEGLMTVSRKHRNVLLSQLRWWNNLKSDEVKKDTRLIVGFLQGGEFPVVTIAGKPGAETVVTPPPTPTPAPVEKENEKEKEAEPVVATPDPPRDTVRAKPVEPVITQPVRTAETGQGFFKPFYEEQIRQTPPSHDETVTAGIFKTTSGWEDGKYYLLRDGIPAGTLVKLINPSGNQVVYAKVLGEMAGIRQNQGLDIRISQAAASVLGIADTNKFILRLVY